MEPNAFVAEIYRRMSLRHQMEHRHPSFAEMADNAQVLQATFEYAPLLPAQRDAPILDVGFGSGWFIAACLKLGYSNIAGADFLVANKDHVRMWQPNSVTFMRSSKTSAVFLLAVQSSMHSYTCRT